MADAPRPHQPPPAGAMCDCAYAHACPSAPPSPFFFSHETLSQPHPIHPPSAPAPAPSHQPPPPPAYAVQSQPGQQHQICPDDVDAGEGRRREGQRRKSGAGMLFSRLLFSSKPRPLSLDDVQPSPSRPCPRCAPPWTPWPKTPGCTTPLGTVTTAIEEEQEETRKKRESFFSSRS